VALNKSSRFSKIAGDFGESLFLYWLGKSGFEPTYIDHSGIDLLAYHKETKRRFGISIKTRVRGDGKESETVNLELGDIPKIIEACSGFDAKPFIGIVVDRASENKIDCFLISLDDLLQISPPGKAVVSIGLKESHWKQYESKSCLRLHFNYTEEGSIVELADEMIPKPELARPGSMP
jgi:hypothetical protein